jgi:hypothetical protein
MSMSSGLSSAPASSLSLPLLGTFKGKRNPVELPKVTAYIFTAGLFIRTLLDSTPPTVQVYCTQATCQYSTVSKDLKLSSTGNLLSTKRKY